MYLYVYMYYMIIYVYFSVWYVLCLDFLGVMIVMQAFQPALHSTESLQVTGPDGRGVGRVLRGGRIALPQPEETQGFFRFSAAFTCRDHFTKGFSLGSQLLKSWMMMGSNEYNECEGLWSLVKSCEILWNLVKLQNECSQMFSDVESVLKTSYIPSDIRLKSSLPHGGHEFKGRSPLIRRTTSAHSSVQGSGIGLQPTTPHHDLMGCTGIGPWMSMAYMEYVVGYN